VIGVDLNAAPCTDQTYQTVTAYFGGTTLVTSQVIGLTHSPSNIVEFKNIDNQPHTAANLGPWTGSYPAQGPNPAATPSPKLADISTSGFTAGNLNPGSTSRHYTANVPGIYVFGCAYHYLSNNMRTVIIVQ
jgi:plastocyanin